MTRCVGIVQSALSPHFASAHACRRDLNFDTVVHTVVLEYNCLISDYLVESTRLAEARVPAEVASVPVFDPISSIGGLGSRMTGAGSEVSLMTLFLMRACSVVVMYRVRSHH